MSLYMTSGLIVVSTDNAFLVSTSTFIWGILSAVLLVAVLFYFGEHLYEGKYMFKAFEPDFIIIVS